MTCRQVHQTEPYSFSFSLKWGEGPPVSFIQSTDRNFTFSSFHMHISPGVGQWVGISAFLCPCLVTSDRCLGVCQALKVPWGHRHGPYCSCSQGWCLVVIQLLIIQSTEFWYVCRSFSFGITVLTEIYFIVIKLTHLFRWYIYFKRHLCYHFTWGTKSTAINIWNNKN